MRTKLVYVLTCAPDSLYIEQALLATYSARIHNPSAYIVLIVDDITNRLITEDRCKIINHINEIIVIPFEEDKSMVYRSRWIKTSVRSLVKGDFLFVDCDTITTKSLTDIDFLNCKMGAVPDSHLLVKEYGEELLTTSKAKVSRIGIDLEQEEIYFSSGVLFVKDVPETHLLYKKWHSIWLQGVQQGLNIDQPALAKANIEIGYLIERIADKYNCIIYTQPDFAKEASILHFTAYRNPSWLFSKRVLNIIRSEGKITDWMVPFILNPTSTYLPFRYSISQFSVFELIRKIRIISNGARIYSHHIDASFSDMNPSSPWLKTAKDLFIKKRFFAGSFFCIFPSWVSIKTKHSNTPIPNICAN